MAKIIYINFPHGGVTASSPWNGNQPNTPTTTGTLIANLVDDAASETGIGLELVTAFLVSGSTTVSSTAGSWPIDALDRYWAGTSTAALQLTGLSDGDTYSIEFAGHRGISGRDTDFTIDSGTPSRYVDSGTSSPTAPIVMVGTVSGTTMDIDVDLVNGASYISGIKITLTDKVVSTTYETGFFIPDPRFEMPSLLEPGRKPVGPVAIDWNHPMTRKLEAYLYAIPGGVIDLVSGRLMTQVNSPSTGIYTPHSGIAADTNGADSYYLLEDMPSKTLYFDDGLALAYSFNSDVSQSDKRPVSFANYGSNFISIECETSQHQGFLRSNSGDFTRSSSSGSNIIGNNYGIYQSNVSANRMTLNMNGVATNNTSAVSGPSFTYDRCAIGCLFRSSAGNFFNGQVPAVCLWGRELTSAEVNDYNNTKGASIYQMLIPA